MPRSRRTSATTSWEVTQAGLSQSRTSAGPGSSPLELPADPLTEQLDELRVGEIGRKPRRALVAAAAVLTRDRRDVHALGRPQADLPGGAAAVGLVANERGDR